MKCKIYRRKKRLKGTVKYSKKTPYTFNPAFRKNDSIIDISKLSIYNKWMINNIIVKKYIRKYKSLLKMVYLLFNDLFPGDTGYPVVLGEIDKLRALLIDKYNQFLEQENYEKFLKELDYIETEVKKKYLEERLFTNQILNNDFIR